MLLTTCKNCNKRFKISQSQLEVAKGFVRCGKCYAVFQAKDNLERIEEEHQQQFLTGDKLNSKLPPRNPNRTLHENNTPHHFNSFKEAEEIIEAEKKSLAANNELTKENQTTEEQSLTTNDKKAPETAHLAEKKQTSFFSTLFSGSAKDKNKKDSIVDVEEAQQTVSNEDNKVDDQTLETQVNPTNDFKESEDIKIAVQDVAINLTENASGNISVEEKSAEEVEEVIKQINAQASATSNNIMPVSVNEQAVQIAPQYYPSPYENEKTQRNDLNWTIASIVALIVLIMQMFYLILNI